MRPSHFFPRFLLHPLFSQPLRGQLRLQATSITVLLNDWLSELVGDVGGKISGMIRMIAMKSCSLMTTSNSCMIQ